jgi:hypothetical protein
MKYRALKKIKNYIITLSFLMLIGSVLAQTKSVSGIDSVATYSKYKMNPKSSLISRVGKTSDAVLERFHQAGMNPSHHTLTTKELEIVTEVLEKIPKIHRQVLKRHLHRISFLDNMPNTALTAPVNPNDSLKLFTITVRAEILHQTITEWLTEKEKSCFDFTNSDIDLRYNAGNLNALVYVLIHEATHIVDAALGIYSNNTNPTLSEALAESSFTKDVWDNRTSVTKKFKNDLLEKVYFRSRETLPISKAQELYEELSQSPFISLYGRNSCHEDFAEFVTIKYLIQSMGQEFSIELTRSGSTIYTYKPLKSRLVKQRIRRLKQVLQRP